MKNGRMLAITLAAATIAFVVIGTLWPVKAAEFYLGRQHLIRSNATPDSALQNLGDELKSADWAQAYDSLAQPPRLTAELALLPAAVLAALTRHYRALAGAACAAVGLAEIGRRRHGGAAVFPWYLPLLAPVWLAERSVCSWLAVGCRLRGGVRYAGQRLPRAATSARMLRGRAAALGAAGGPESNPRMRAVAKRLQR